MAFDIIIESGFFVVNDTSATEHIRVPRELARFTINSSTYRFYWKVPVQDGGLESYILGGENNTFAYADLGSVIEDGVTITIANEAALTTYLSGKISLEVPVDKETRSVYKMLAQIQPAVANTPESLYSPPVDSEVHILSLRMANLSNQDIQYTVYLDDNGTTWDATTTILKDKVKKNKTDVGIKRDEGFVMRDSTGSIGIKMDDTNATITLWGVEYDKS